MGCLGMYVKVVWTNWMLLMKQCIFFGQILSFFQQKKCWEVLGKFFVSSVKLRNFANFLKKFPKFSISKYWRKKNPNVNHHNLQLWWGFIYSLTWGHAPTSCLFEEIPKRHFLSLLAITSDVAWINPWIVWLKKCFHKCVVWRIKAPH